MTRALNVVARKTDGTTKSRKYNYISTTATATTMKTAVQDLYSLSQNTYVDATIINSLSLNEEADEEEE